MLTCVKKAKAYLRKKIYNMNYKFLMRDIILMESHPDFVGSPGALYREIINRKLNNKYKIVWLTQKDYKSSIHNVSFINRKKHKMLLRYYSYFAKYIIDCNIFIHKKNKYQFRYYQMHGNFLKIPDQYTSGFGTVDFVNETSSFFDEFAIKYFKVNNNQITHLGYPQNDDLFHVTNEFNNYLNAIKAKKIIVWLPTYRNHKITLGFQSQTGLTYKYGVPCLNTKDEIIKLNDLLKLNYMTLIIKPHPAENTRLIEELNLTNIIITNDSVLEQYNLNVYKLLAGAKAMITDYSSVYFDFLITKRPIGLAIPDLDKYTEHVKLITDDYEKDIPGEHIYNYNDLITFINNVISDNDISYEKRMSKLELYNKYCDDNSTERVLNFFLDKIGYKDNK